MIGRGGQAVRTTLGMLLLGDYGTWKSSIALESLKLQIPEVVGKKTISRNSRVLYIDVENGSVDSYLKDYEDNGYNLRNIYIVYTQSFNDIQELVKRVKDNDEFYEFDENGEESDEIYLDSDGKPFCPDVIVIDGMALLYHAKEEQYLKLSEKRARVKMAEDKDASSMKKQVAIEGADLEFKEYKKLQFDGNRLIMDLIGSGKHWIVTCFAKDETKEELGLNGKAIKNKMGQVQKIRTGNFIPEGFKDLVKYCKTVLYLYEDEETGDIKGLIQRKDRSRMFQQNDVIESPSLTMWQPFLSSNLDKAVLSIANTMDESINKDLKKDLKKSQKEEINIGSDEETNENADNSNEDPTYYQSLIIGRINSTLPGVARKEVVSKLSSLGIKSNTLKDIKDIELLKKALELIK